MRSKPRQDQAGNTDHANNPPAQRQHAQRRPDELAIGGRGEDVRLVGEPNLQSNPGPLQFSAARATAITKQLDLRHGLVIRRDLASQLAQSYDREAANGRRVIAAVLGFGCVCTAFIPITSAVAVIGTLVSGSSTKKVQHPTGGVISEILVKDGSHVTRGDVVARLDEVTARANFGVAETQLVEADARVARLSAERDGTALPQWPPGLAARASQRKVAQILESEREQFLARSSAHDRQIAILQKHVLQIKEEVSGLESQLAAKDQQAGYVKKELEGLQNLFRQQLVSLPRLSAVAREAAQLEGDRSQLRSAISQNRTKVEEAELQISAASEQHRVEVTKELGEVQSKQSELLERHAQARDLAGRAEIRAPDTGTVSQVAIHTAGGVVGAGDVLMLIVPDKDELVVEAHVPPKEIDQVSAGQPATVRLSAFERATTPELQGRVCYVSPDASRDPQSNIASYEIRITLSAAEVQRLGNNSLRLRPGMPAEAFLQTGSRTILSYLFKPLSDQLHRMFREN